MELTNVQVSQILEGNKEWKDWVDPLNRLLPKYDISTTIRVAAFLAQCCHESRNFIVREENLNYSEEALLRVFGKYFKKDSSNPTEVAAYYARHPEMIANRVYANRMGNGNSGSGDGWKYRGRGIIQLTGKNNYKQFATFFGKSIDNAIDYIETKEGALASACWFWSINKLNVYADSEDIVTLTKRINGGTHGLEDRRHHYNRIKNILLNRDSNTVQRVQEKLGLVADGIIGPNTIAAIKRWQATHGLLVDGILGPKTTKSILG